MRNGNLGIETVPQVTDGGGNHAFANGNPLPCSSNYRVLKGPLDALHGTAVAQSRVGRSAQTGCDSGCEGELLYHGRVIVQALSA